MKSSRLVLAASLALFMFSIMAQEAEKQGSLRSGIKADQQTIKLALAMQEQGWEYIMPSPKSAQAAWGNSDGRTTWYVGYWKNSKTGETSDSTPRLKNGKYVGDSAGGGGWRRGGCPSAPTKIQWLLSKNGGIKPRG